LLQVFISVFTNFTPIHCIRLVVLSSVRKLSTL